MKRDQNHILEEKSKRRLAAIIPDSWTINEPKDYGIDGIVEIFENEETTGKFFNFQLKATNELNLKKALKLSFEIEKLEYYHQCDLPTLILRYCSVSDDFFCVWAHYVRLEKSNENQKTITIEFFERDKISEEFIENIPNFIDNYRIVKNRSLTLPYSVELNILCDEFSNNSKSRIINEFNKRIKHSDMLSNDNRLKQLKIDILEDSIEFGFLGHYSFGYRKYPENQPASQIVNDLYLGIGLILARYSHRNNEIEFMKDAFLNSLYRGKKIPQEDVLNLLFSFERYDLVIDVVNDLNHVEREVLYNNTEIRVLLFIMRFDISEENLLDKYKDTMLQITNEFEKDKGSLGYSYYNSANILFNNLHQYRDAARYYLKAARNCPDYKESDYFWREIGAALFESKHYLYARNSYMKYMELNSQIDIRHLVSDCNFYLGRYSEAYVELNEYLESKENFSSNDYMWLSKYFMINDIVNGLNTDVQKRDSSNASKILVDGGIEGEQCNLKSLRCDALNSVAWFNLGLYYSEKMQFERSFRCFRNCLVIDDSDTEALFNALKAGLSADKVCDGELYVLFRSVHYTQGDVFKEKFLDYVFEMNLGVDFENMVSDYLKIYDESFNMKNQGVEVMQSSNLIRIIQK